MIKALFTAGALPKYCTMWFDLLVTAFRVRRCRELQKTSYGGSKSLRGRLALVNGELEIALAVLIGIIWFHLGATRLGRGGSPPTESCLSRSFGNTIAFVLGRDIDPLHAPRHLHRSCQQEVGYAGAKTGMPS